MPDLVVGRAEPLPFRGEAPSGDSRILRYAEELEDAGSDFFRVADQVLVPYPVTGCGELFLRGQDGTCAVNPEPCQRPHHVAWSAGDIRVEPIAAQAPRTCLDAGRDHVHRVAVQAQELRLRIDPQQQLRETGCA